MTEKTALDLLRETGGQVTDEVLEKLGEEQFADRLPQPPPSAAPPPPPVPQAEPEEDGGPSREHWMRYRMLREHAPEQFERVRAQMMAWAENHPEDFQKWDTSHRHFLEAYDEFNKELTRAEYRAKFGKDVRFKEEVDAETLARRAAEEEYRQAEAERLADLQMREDLATAYRDRDWQAAEKIEERMARRVLGTEPRPQPPRKAAEPPPERTAGPMDWGYLMRFQR